MNETVAVIVPIRNEEAHIGKCVDSILNQSYPSNLIEIILVDGMSDDGTIDVLNNYKKKYKNIKVLKNEKQITPIAMNIGIKNSNTDIVIILGAHSYIEKDFVKNNVRNLVEKGAEASGGIIKFVYDSLITKSIGEATSCPFGIGNSSYRYATQEKYVDTVPFAAYKRKTLDKIGYFDEELIRNQDDEMNFRVSESGGKILLSPDIVSYYTSRSSLHKLWSQYFQYGFWKVRVIQKHNRPASIRHLVPMLFIMFLVLSLILGIFIRPVLYMFLGVVLLYLTCDIIFSLKTGMKNEIKSFPYLLIIFPMLHFSYGFGFIKGIIKFYL